MENSSKALLIAAAVLIVILLIAFSIKILNSPQEVQEQATNIGTSISKKNKDAIESIKVSLDIDREVSQGGTTSTTNSSDSTVAPSDEIQNSTISSTQYHIYTVEDLKNFADLVNNGNNFEGITVYLENDLDLKNEEWTPIGSTMYYDQEKQKNKIQSFKGTFEGQNHYIRRINVNSDTNFAGLFGYANKIKDLTVKDSTIESEKKYVGGIAGVVTHIENCISQNNEIIGESFVGGIIGYAYTNSQSSNCTSQDNEITGNSYVGGMIGYAHNNSRISNCINKSKVKTILSAEDMNEDINKYGSNTGGIVGYIHTGTIINECINEGNVISNRGRIGGIVGCTTTENVAISNCINKGDIEVKYYDGGENNVGGIVGIIPTDTDDPSSNTNESNRISISYCYNEGNIKGINYVGGIAGSLAQYMSLIHECYNEGKIEGNALIGGICAAMGRSSQIINCYNKGDVSVNIRGGGILGTSYNSANGNGGIINCYNLGKINNEDNSKTEIGSESDYVAEILGDNQNGLILKNCITDRGEIKDQFISNAIDNGNDVWEIKSGINNGYPVLVGMN